MRRLAGTGDEDAVVRVEPVVKPVEVEVAVRAIHVGVGHVDVAARIRPPKHTRYLLKTPPVEYSPG